MYSLRWIVHLSVTLLILLYANAIEVFGKPKHLPPEISKKLDDYWRAYKTQFNKTYSGNLENARRIAWEQNLMKIYEHNLMAAAGHHGYMLRDNHIADLNTQQYVREMVKLIPSSRRRVSEDEMVSLVHHDPSLVPSRLDWREMGFVTESVNQMNCGSCYAYSIAGTIEGQIFKQTGMIMPLSKQQLVDCSTITGNVGCGGGSLRNTLRYLERSKGLMPQSLYPYIGKAMQNGTCDQRCQLISQVVDTYMTQPTTALYFNVLTNATTTRLNANFRSNSLDVRNIPKQGQCRFIRDRSVVNITSWAVLPARDEKALQVAVATIGPIAASINASPKTFQLYHQGVYDDVSCSSDSVNHAVLIVGYTPTEWILKNWWGRSWGENGYMRLARHKNRCGIANYAAYARV